MRTFQMPEVPMISSIPTIGLNGSGNVEAKNYMKFSSKNSFSTSNNQSSIDFSKNHKDCDEIDDSDGSNLTASNNRSTFRSNSETPDIETKLCPQCSKTLMQTLLPIELCLKNLFKLIDPNVLDNFHRSEHSISKTKSNNESNRMIRKEPKSKDHLCSSSIRDDRRDLEHSEIGSPSKLNDCEIDSPSKVEKINDSLSLDNKMSQDGCNKFSIENNFLDSKLVSDQNRSMIEQDLHSNHSKVEIFNDLINCNNSRNESSIIDLVIVEEKPRLSDLKLDDIEKIAIDPKHSDGSNRFSMMYETRAENLNTKNRNKEKTIGTRVEIEEEDCLRQTNRPNDCPYAYVTIIQNNLAACNAIIMINSLRIYRNNQMTIYDDNDNDNVNQTGERNLKRSLRIPSIALVDSTMIDPILTTLIKRIFDRIIEIKSNNLVLLNDQSLGINHSKVHLWKELSGLYTKCLYLDPNLLIVGQISNLFVECEEFSAPVDCFFPDYFDCSVFVFEPNERTYQSLIDLGVRNCFGSNETNRSLTNCSNGNLNNSINDDNHSLDEITLLNAYFANKWNRLSFVYNFVRNDSSYTQMAANFKFGGDIRIVNLISHNLHTGSHSNQPWYHRFDLNRNILFNDSFENEKIDDYSRFYLIIFLRRLWPLLLPKLTSLIQKQKNRTLWSVREIIYLISRETDAMDSLVEQKSFTLRRRKISSSKQSKQNLSNLKDSKPEIMDQKFNQKISLDVSTNSIDWLDQHCSDNIIDRLISKF
ncbi:Glycogenin-1 [Sarcoptes scabiei]|uniref:Glycogenin-1 n=1 Tax=Sarcoptes scabiei TaxID=52283 RepID=A0A834RFR8_SARSC|nr:Glycogenin-1 [Sarcoptes scabiei]